MKGSSGRVAEFGDGEELSAPRASVVMMVFLRRNLICRHSYAKIWENRIFKQKRVQ